MLFILVPFGNFDSKRRKKLPTGSRSRKRNMRIFYNKTRRLGEHNVVVNLSDKKLNDYEFSLLNKGLGFVPSHFRPNLDVLTKDIVRFERRLQIHYFFSNEGEIDNNQGFNRCRESFVPVSTWVPPRPNLQISKFCLELKKGILKILNTVPICNLSAKERKFMHSLKKDDSVVIKKADKGGGIAVLNTSDYVDKVSQMLNDSKVYSKLNNMDAISTKEQADIILLNLFRRGRITHKQFSFLTDFIPRNPIFYGLPKLHKAGVPLRPVVSQVNGPTCMVNALVDKLLTVAESKIPFLLKDTTAFLMNINDLNNENIIDDELLLVTMDVCSMYTNIPHDEGIELVTSFYEQTLQFWKDFDLGVRPVLPEELAEMIEFILKNCEFTFGNSVYKQNYGTTMGAKFSVKFANIYMFKWFEKFLAGYNDCIPSRLCRLVDDIFFVWPYGLERLLKFRDFLNSVHNSIKFDMEYSTSEVHFLDTVVFKFRHRLETKIFTKPTDKKQYLHFTSCHPAHVMRAIPYSQTIRYRRNISLDHLLMENMSLLKDFFLARGYPIPLLDCEIGRITLLDRKETLRYRSIEEKREKFLAVLKGRTFLPLIIVYYHQYSSVQLSRLLENCWYKFLDSKLEIFNVFADEFPMLVFKRGRTLGSILTKSRFLGDVDPTLYYLKDLFRAANT
jgi:hypothetical protein